MSDHLFIRRARPDDYSLIVTLVNVCFEDEILPSRINEDTEETISKLEAGGSALFVLVNSDVIVGFVYVDPSRKGIFKLSVHPTQRGKGYGQLLMEAAEAHGRSLGWDEILLGIYETKARLINYYAKQGYTLTGELKELSLADDVSDGLPLLVMLSKPLVG